MSKIDPFTGCQVMTQMDFFHQEDIYDGKEPGTSLQEYYHDVNEACDYEEKKFQDYNYALNYLREAVEEYNGYDPDITIPMPIEVKNIIHVNVSMGMKKDSTSLEAEAIDENGKLGVIQLDCNSWSGSVWEPPDYELNVFWKGES
jgi:hypothetical protein